jgi:hypothetical protein
MERINAMKRSSIAVAVVLSFALFACNKQSTTPTASNNTPAVSSSANNNLTPEQLGELGAKIKKHPADAQKLLSEQGLDEATFERAVRKVAESPDESKRYAAAYKRSS